MLECCALRNGNVHSADGWQDVLDPVIARYAKRDIMRFFRADAAYAIPAIPAIDERLEEAGYFCAIRLPTNAVLRSRIAHRMTRPVGRPSLTKIKRLYEDFEYQAASWDKPRRFSPRSNGIRASCSQKSASSSPTCPWTRTGWCGSTTLPLDAAVMQAVPRQRGPAATARAGRQPGHLSALHRSARGHG